MTNEKIKMAQSLEAVRERERERERESYTLVNKGKSAVLLSIQRNLKNENKFKHRLFIYVHFLCT